jgi:uncharacterized membrane protein
MKRFFTLAKAAVIVLSLIAVSIVLSLLATGSNDLPAWIQAVGSIAALVGAIFIMSRQNEHAAKLVADADRIATLRKVNSIRAILTRYYNQLVLANIAIHAERITHAEKI